MRTLTIDGTNIVDKYHATYAGSDDDGAPERDSEEIDIPGRNGTIAVDKGRWKNKQVNYYCFMDKSVKEDLQSFRCFLLSLKGKIVRLEDSDKSNEYRMGRVSDSFDPARDIGYSTASFKITVSCHPYRRLVSGDEIFNISTSGSEIDNPSCFDAYPLITVYGTGPGTVTVGSVTLNIISLTDYLKIDCEEMNVYRETAENKNNCVSLGEYPSIPEGKSKVTFTGGITSVDIMPRWWML